MTQAIQVKKLQKVEVPEKYQDELSFEPKEKELEANEAFILSAFFVPQQKRHYKINVPIEAVEDVISQNL